MPLYNARLTEIDPKETRRYAGLAKAADFDEKMVTDACTDALLLAEPRGIWQEYEYDEKTCTVKSDPPFHIEGEKIAAHLAGCERVVVLACTVGDGIEDEVTKEFRDGKYVHSVLLDAAATTAVEQIADMIELDVKPRAKAKGYSMKWRFSPGYGDWPLAQQPELIRVTHAAEIGVGLSDALMLVPRKSVTAIIGLIREQKQDHSPNGCAACTNYDCPMRNTK